MPRASPINKNKHPNIMVERLLTPAWSWAVEAEVEIDLVSRGRDEGVLDALDLEPLRMGRAVSSELTCEGVTSPTPGCS